jgi:hypothetical protein
MKDALKNIFAAQAPQRQTATVVQRISRGRYRLADRTGRPCDGLSNDVYAPGAEVLIESGRIVSLAEPKPNKRYEV